MCLSERRTVFGRCIFVPSAPPLGWAVGTCDRGYSEPMRTNAERLVDGREVMRSSRSRVLRRLVLVGAAMTLGLWPHHASAQSDLAVGAGAGDSRVQATLTATGAAGEYDGIAGSWFIADVTLTGVSGLKASAILDWRLITGAGNELMPFPGGSASVPDGQVGAGQTVTIKLGFDITGQSGPARLVYQPFLDAGPLAVWSVAIETPVVTIPIAVDPLTSPPFTSPPFTPSIGVPVPNVFGGAEGVRSFHAVYDIQTDGTILVSETIDYDFGVTPRHGIFRDLALFQPIDSDHERKYPITDVTVSAAEGTPDRFELLRNGDFERIKIGDAKITIDGGHRYVIAYRLSGALNPQPAGPELYFNVTGRWPVPMSDVIIEVHAPGGVENVTCYAGPTGSTSTCDESAIDAGVARYHEAGLEADGQLTIVAALPLDSVQNVGPILGEAPRDLRDAVEPDPVNMGGAAGVGVAGLMTVGTLVWRKGRDLVADGSPVDAVMAPDELPARRLPVLRRVVTPVEFVPPDGARPGLLGTLYDERVDPVDVSATIVDLAVRGYLKIEEIPKSGLFGRSDHHLSRLDGHEDRLLPYERILLNGLFAGGVDGRFLSELKNTFAPTLERVTSSMYAQTVERGWFERRPDATRTRWVLWGTAVTTLGGLAIAGAVIAKRWVWPGAAILLIGLIFTFASRWMPRRTSHGTSVIRRAEGFRRFIVESEVRRAEFAERKHLFTEYLPYAIVFGCVDKWAATFADLSSGELPDTGGWYVGTGGFNSRHFSRSMNGFTSSAGSTMSSTPGGSGGSGSSGGSSGGGGGGGGGGSW